MILYAESSAVLAWLLRQTVGPAVETILANAAEIVTSELTLLECNRAFHREVALGRMPQANARQVTAKFDESSSSWRILQFLAPIVARAKQRFPQEPIRSLDALHVASALYARTASPEIALLSLDDRIRRVGESVGLPIVPN